MKKINLLFIVIFCLFLSFEVNLKANSNNEFNVIGAQIRSTGNAGIRFVCNANKEENSNIKNYGLLLAYGNVENVDNLYINAKVNNKEVVNILFDSITDTTYSVTIFNIPQSQYTTIISARSYMITNDDEIIYSDELISRSLKDVAIKAYKDNDRSEFVQNIYNKFSVSLITLSINFALKTYTEENEIYSLTYSNPKYDKVKIIITLNENYFFSDNVKIKYNDFESKDNEITISENVLIFNFKDPYWTGIY